MDAGYYVEKKICFLKSYDRVAARVSEILRRYYGRELVKKIMQKTHSRFEALLPKLPFIGGHANPMTTNLIQAAWCLAFYKTLASYGEPVEQAGRILYEAVEAQLQTYPRLLLYPCSVTRITETSIDELKERAANSEKSPFAEDWVFEVVDGNGKNFDVGVNYLQCGMCKFFHAQDADELAPYLCALNCPISEGFGVQLSQGKTLATGGKMCRLRMKKPKHHREHNTADFRATT